MSVLEIRRLGPGLEAAAFALLRQIEQDPSGHFFTPHPFTRERIALLAHEPGKDLYYLLMEAGDALAYGMLRGWNEGFAIPSLGLAVSPGARGQGLGALMTDFLHAAARRAGARKVRLRVHHGNLRALALYRRCGYAFDAPGDPRDGLLVGYHALAEG